MKKSDMKALKKCFGEDFDLQSKECFGCQFQKKCKSFINCKCKNR